MKKIYSVLPAILVLISLSVATLHSSAQLSGSYTIDPSQPTGGTNFKYFGDALTALNTIGVNDTTVFNIASGVYDTLLTFSSAIPGMGATAPITFQSATGNAADVTLRHTASSTTNNYIIDINGAKYLTVKNLSLQSLSGTYGRCISIRNSSENININSNNFGSTTTTNYDYGCNLVLIYNSSTSADNNINISRNNFINGSCGIWMDSPSAILTENGNFIIDNSFSNYYEYGIFVKNQRNVLISNNSLSTTSSYSGTVGINLNNNFSNCVITNNKIVQTKYGICIFGSIGDSTFHGEISNNFITVGGSSTTYGIYLSGSDFFNIFHNSVNCYSSAGSSFYISDCDSLEVYNNIFASTGGAKSISIYSPVSLVSDYNNLFSTGSIAFYYNGSNITSLSNWTTSTQLDSNSICKNPAYKSQTDLHLSADSLNDLGTFVGIPIDIDNETRNSLTPDIGADEFTPYNSDAGVCQIIEPSNSTLNTDTLYSFIIKIKNYGTDTISKIKIGWSINGIIQLPFEWSQLLPQDSISPNVYIGPLTFNTMGNYNIKVWTYLPNDSIDQINTNDTISAHYFVCNGTLSGVYSVNSITETNNGNFQFFSDIQKAFSQCGISDTTVFNIASGVYDTLLSFDTNIPGFDATTPVTFQSSTGNATDVVLRHNSNSTADNYVIDLNGSSYFSFRNITFEALGNTYGTCINLRNNANNILAEGNIFKGPSTTSTSTNMALINNFSTTVDTNIIIRNNKLINGSYSIFMRGSSSSLLETGNIIEGNTITDYCATGIYATLQKNIIISGNSISSSTNNTSSAGIYAGNMNYGKISGNKIIQPNNCGISLNACYSNSTASLEVSNNFVSIGGSDEDYGISLIDCDNSNIFHNSVNCSSTSYGGNSIYIYSCLNPKIKNNILVNTGGGGSIKCSSSTFTSDYNILFSTGSYLGFYNISSQPDLSSWQTASSQDSHSINSDPSFISATDLHVSSFSFNDLGTYTGIMRDIDGEIRNMTTPDIGADEYTQPSNNSGVTEITYPAPGKILEADTTYAVKIKIINSGLDTLEKVNINWGINGILQSPFLWTGSLLSDSVSPEVQIGTLTFSNTGNNAIKIWTSLPNDSLDIFAIDDTIRQIYYVCSLVFAGTYTIDPASPSSGNNFQNFTEMMNVLNECGVSDTTVFNIANGIYDTLLTFSDSINGIGPDAPLIFQSASGNASDVTLRNNASYGLSNYIIDINGARFITFRNLTFHALGNTYGRCVALRNTCNNIVFENNVIIGQPTTSTSLEMALLQNFASYNDTNIVVRNNKFMNGSYGVYMSGIFSTNEETANTVEGNEFLNYYISGISSMYQKDLLITGNSFSTNSTYASTCGIKLEKNKNYHIIKNKIISPTYCGIYLNICDGSSLDFCEIINNFISVGGDAVSRGISLVDCDYINIYHNSILCTGTSATDGAAFHGNSLNNYNVKNNIFSNSGGGFAFYTNSSIVYSDYNDFYSTGPYICSYYSQEAASLSEWLSLMHCDSNSINIDPAFFSSTDLHTQLSILADLGTPVGVIDDIDNEARSLSSPDIGADEYQHPTEDVGVYLISEPIDSHWMIPLNSYDVKVRVVNYGADTLKKVSIAWMLNGSIQPNYLWMGNIPHDSVSSDILIGTVTFPDYGLNTITVWTLAPNDSVDPCSGNDTIGKSYFLCQNPLAGVYTIDSAQVTNSSNFRNFNDAMTYINSCGLSDTTVFRISAGEYNEQLSFDQQIPGLGSTAPLILESLSGNPSDVVFYNYDNSYSNTYVFDFNGSSSIAVRNLTLNAQSTQQGTCISLRNGANNILIENSVITGSSQTSLIVNADSSNENNILIRNNSLIGGADGIIFASVLYSHEYGNSIYNNTIINYRSYGLKLTNQNQLIINNNTISANSGSGSTIGIKLERSSNYSISKNKIYQPRDCGIFLDNCNGSSTNPCIISNNFITVKGSTTSYGINASNSSYNDVYHNSINLECSYYGSYAFYYDVSINFNFRNNIFACSGGGISFYDRLSGTFTSDYNDLFTTGPNLTYADGFYQSSLAAWTAYSHCDSNSVSVAPDYYSDSNLHINNLLLNDAGTPIGIIDDIDGSIRSTTHPDIGADEFSVNEENAGVIEISEPISSPVPLIGTPYPVKVRIINFGNNSLTKVNIEWDINGSPQPTFNWTGLLSPDSISNEITIDTINFSAVGDNEIKMWTSLPNDSIDVFTLNDTLTKHYFVCTYALAGNYTINPAAPTAGTNFKYFADVSIMLNTCGVMDTTVFEIASGIYDTLLRFDGNIPGMNVAIPITFQSLSGNPDDVIIRNNENHNLTSKNYLIQLNSVNNMTFRNLTFNAENESYGNGRCIVFNGLNSNLLFEGNHFIGAIYLDIPEFSLVYSSGSTNNNTVFRNNIFEEGAYGVYMYGVSETNPGNGNIFDGNQFIGYDNKGLYLTYQNDLTISDNTFQLSFMDYYYPIGIDLNYCNNVNISMNKIQGRNCCLHLNYCSGDGLSPSMVMNNFFSVYGTYHDVAVNIENTSYFNFFHNSLNCVSSDTTSGVALKINLSSDIQFKNNIISNTAGGKSLYFYSDYSSLNSDYNNMYTTGPVLCSAAGSNISTLNDWSAYSGGDTHSISSSPNFVSDIDLHCGDTASHNAGVYLGIAIDIDNELRNQLYPDLGADEFSIANVFSTVYPGDISNDALVDGNDLLLLGLNYNVSGTLRDSVSIEWLPQTSFDWGANMSGAALDLKFADCNGDGITLDSDTNAISQNYGLTHTFKTGITPDFPKATQTVSLLFPDTVMVNTPTQIEVVLGDAANPFTDLHGINFDFNLNTNVHITSFSLTSLLAAPSAQLKLLKNTGTNEFSLAFTKTDGTGFNGYGSAAILTMVFDSIASLPFEGSAIISNPVCLNADGSWHAMTGPMSSFILAGGTTGMNDNNNMDLSMCIHPNPASTQTEISFNLPAPGKCVLTLRNTLGELIQTTTIDGQSGENSVNVDLSRLGQGIYVYTLEYKDVVLTRRLSVMR